MSLSINTNNSALVALESLNATQAQLSQAENTVSTGQKISNAADNPAIYAIASSMNGNLQGLSAVSDSLSLGAQVVSTANTGANFITSTLQTLQNTVTAAGQTGIDASAMASQVLSAIDTINSYARNATFSGVNLLTSGSDAVNAYNGTTLQTLSNLQGSTIQFASAAGSDTTLVDKLGLSTGSAAGAKAIDSTQNIFSALNSNNVSNVNTSALSTSDITLGTGTTGAGTTVTVGSKVFEFVQSGSQVSTTGNIAVALNTGFSTTTALSALTAAMNGNGVSATLNSDNSLSVEAASANISMKSPARNTFDLSSLTATFGDATSSTDTTVAASDAVTVGGTTYEFTKDTGTASGTTLKDGFTAIQIGSSATKTDAVSALATFLGAGYSSTGTTLSYGGTAVPTITPATIATNGTSTPGSAITATAVAAANVTNFVASAGKARDQLAVGFKDGVATAVSALQSAINNMSAVSQTLGNYSNQITGLQTYTSNVSDALTTGVGALTNADMAAASAKLTSLQTKQQLAIKSLTIANSQSQNILSLFQ